MKTPFLFPGRGVDRVEITIPTSKKENAIGVSRRSVHDIAGLKFPA